MKKKITAMIFALILCLCAVTPAFAANSDGFVGECNRLNDAANLLTDSEEAELLAKLDEISLRQQMDVTVATVTNLGNCNTATECADEVYEFSSFGYGQSKDGLMLLISAEERDWAISTCGYGITAFTDAGIEYIGKQMKSDLSDGNYASAFNTYADLCDEFITQARSGSPYDKGSLPRESLSIIWLPISVVIGSMKGKLKSVQSQAAANSYMKKDSHNVTESADLFLYHNMTRTEKKKESSSEGSSTHTSSSGTTHGGGSGKF